MNLYLKALFSSIFLLNKIEIIQIVVAKKFDRFILIINN